MSSTPDRPTVAVVGGGVSGIAAAHYLTEAGRRPELFERDPVLGGRVAPALLGDRHVELGGKNIGRRYHRFRAFARAHGDPALDHIGINTARVTDGQLRVLDASRRVRSFLGQLSRLHPTDLLRFAGLALRVRLDEREGFLGGPRLRRLAEGKGDPVVTELFSPSFCRETWRPMSLLMNAAEPDEIHLGTLGTNVSMALDDYDQLRDGMAPLLDRFAASLPTRLGTTVTGLDVRDGRVCGLRWRGSDGSDRHTDHDDVVLALPAGASARLLAPHHPALARELEAVRYFPTLVVVAEYDRDIFRPEVRALRFDDGPVSNARAYATDALHRVRYTFSGRDARPLLVDPIDPEALLDEAESRLSVHFPVASARRLRWTAPPRALSLCAYSQHHADRLERMAALAGELQGLHLTGDYLRGASIEACFRAAHDCVGALTAALAIGAPRRSDRAVS